MRRRRPRSCLAALTSFAVGGCTGGGTPAVRSEVDTLRGSVEDIGDATINPASLSTLEDSVTSSLSAATSSPSAGTISGVGAAVREPGTALSARRTSVKGTC